VPVLSHGLFEPDHPSLDQVVDVDVGTSPKQVMSDLSHQLRVLRAESVAQSTHIARASIRRRFDFYRLGSGLRRFPIDKMSTAASDVLPWDSVWHGIVLPTNRNELPRTYP